jgi:aryl-phospho-beta-D-glucosidase BglC (GH1 family)
MIKVIILISLNLFCTIGSGQKFDFVKVIPGKGIIYNGDSIFLFRTTIKETCKILKIKDETNSGQTIVNEWYGFETGGSELVKYVLYKSLVFEFASPESINSLKLRSVLIYHDKSLKVYTDSGLEIGRINPKITDIYPFKNKCDTIINEGMNYKLCSYGVSFNLDKTDNNELRLSEIEIYKKYE